MTVITLVGGGVIPIPYHLTSDVKASVLDTTGEVYLMNCAGPYGLAQDIDPAKTARITHDRWADDRLPEEDLRLARYLIRKGHTSPLEMIETWWMMALPLFVARQMIRHRTHTVNEQSARFSVLEGAFYVPEPEHMGVTGLLNKQSRILRELSSYELQDRKAFKQTLLLAYEEDYADYLKAVSQGIPKETARLILPVGIYTKWIWKQDLHNLCHLLALRIAEDAQFEARAYAWAMLDILVGTLPGLMGAMCKYRFDSIPLDQFLTLNNLSSAVDPDGSRKHQFLQGYK